MRRPLDDLTFLPVKHLRHRVALFAIPPGLRGRRQDEVDLRLFCSEDAPVPLHGLGWVYCSTLAYCTGGGVHCVGAEPPASIASLNAELPIHIPESARLLGVRRQNGMDDLIQVKLEMSAADLPALLASSPLADQPLEGWERHGIFGSDHDFWDPHQVPNLRSAETGYPDARRFRLGIDERRPEVVVVYLVDHGT